MHSRTIRSRRGNALVLTLLIMSALGSLGFLAAQRVGTDLAVVGHLSRMTQIQGTSDMGMVFTFAYLTQNPTQTVAYLDIQRRGGDASLGIAASNAMNLTTGTVSATGTTQQNRMALLLPASSNALRFVPLARAAHQVAHDSRIYYLKETSNKAGNAVNSGICYTWFDVNSRGWAPRLDGADLTSNPETLGLPLITSRSRVSVGPMPCRYTTGND